MLRPFPLRWPWPGQMKETGNPAAEDENGLAGLQAGYPLAANDAGQGFDKDPFVIGDLIGKQKDAAIDIQTRYPDKFRETAGVVVCRMQGFASRVMASQAIMTGIARDMMGNENPVSRLVLLDICANFNNLPCNLMPQNDRGLF